MIIDRDCYGVIITFLDLHSIHDKPTARYIHTLSSSIFDVDEATSRGLFVFGHLRFPNLRRAIAAGQHNIACQCAPYLANYRGGDLLTPYCIIASLSGSSPALINYYSYASRLTIDAMMIRIIFQQLEKDRQSWDRSIDYMRLADNIIHAQPKKTILGLINICGVDVFDLARLLDMWCHWMGHSIPRSLVRTLRNHVYRDFKITSFVHADPNDILSYLQSGRYLCIRCNFIVPSSIPNHDFITIMIRRDHTNPRVDRIKKLMPVIDFIFNDPNVAIHIYAYDYLRKSRLPRYYKRHRHESWFIKLASLVEYEIDP